jgi:SAM-dependent methyltransferase
MNHTKKWLRHKQDWEELGNLDPFWAIVNEPRKRFGRWDIDAFFANGEYDIEQVMLHTTQLGYPLKRESVLDFGCGLGRTTRALAHYFQRYYGVDIAESMIAKAKELNKSILNCQFILNNREDLQIFPDNSFDMIYTNNVLQHIPDTLVIKSYISEFVRTLKDYGLLVFQLPTHIPLINRIQPRRRMYAFLRKLGFTPEFLYYKLGLFPGMSMNFIHEREVLDLLNRLGTKLLDVQVNSNVGPSIQNRNYYLTRIYV